ncbi:MAG: Calx-beta domain-containing protein [Anaerolineae bacterium]
MKIFTSRHRRVPPSSLLIILPALFLFSIFWSGSNFFAEASTAQQTRTIQFSKATESQNEGENDTSHSLTLQISPALTGSERVTVTYSTVEVTAQGNADYTSVTGEVVFDSTSATETITYTIRADTLNEEAESFFIQLKNPENAILGVNSSIVITILANDPLPTATPTSTASAAATQVYIDTYEGNDTIQTSYSLDAVTSGACIVEDATFWPAGDVDFYRFWAQASATYTLASAELTSGLDTILTLYDPEGNQIMQNDDTSPGLRTSTLTFTPSRDAWHYFSLVNEDPSNPAGKTYCVTMSEIAPTVTPSPTPTTVFEQSAANDACAVAAGFTDNDIPENSCVLSSTSVTQDNFVPRRSDIRDIDYYRIWVKTNSFYTCDTLEGISEFNDTRMKFLDQNRNLISENDDFDATSSGSKLSYLATYTGWMYVFVEPTIDVEYRIADKYTYTLTCSAEVVTPTSTPRPTQVPSTGTGGGGGNAAVRTSTPTPTMTAEPLPQSTIDVLATVQAASTPTPPPTPRPNISINPLPTMIPPVTPVYAADLQVVLFYDRNQNNLPEIDEGIVDMAVLAKDGNTGQLLALGYTNEAGLLRFQVSPSAESLVISIPYFSIDQTISVSATELLIRVAPSALPVTLP